MSRPDARLAARYRRGPCAAIGMWIALSPCAVVSAQSPDGVARELEAIAARARELAAQPLRRQAPRSPTHVEERLTDGELYYRLRDYLRAAIIFTDIVDNHPQHRAYPDALYLLGDSLFRAGDYLGSRTRLRQLIERGDEPSFRPYVQRALGRLIEIAVRTRDFDGVEDYFTRLARLPPAEVEAATNYYRAKYLYNRAVPTEEVVRERREGEPPPQVDAAMLEQARQLFEAVQEASPYHLQARYFIGVIHALRGQFPQAIEAFRRVLRGRAESIDERQVVELAQLALGRLYYETEQLEQAVEAYQSVPRTSAHFDVALYEIAWVYIRQGDATRAERALEVLTVATPDSRHVPDGKILRGNLLLRNGRFEDADDVFREIRGQFGPVREELDRVLEAHADVFGYFRDLVRQNLDAFDPDQFLPPLARRWATLEGDMDRALRVLGDLAQARQLVRETSDLVERLNAALRAVNAVNVFPDLRANRQGTIALRNRLARARRQLLEIEGRQLGGAGGEIAAIRAQRREIESMLGRMPVRDEDFALRNEQLMSRYRRLSQQLRELQVEVMGLEARIVASERFLGDGATVARDPGVIERARATVGEERAAVAAYRGQLRDLERALEINRVQVGIGDARYQRDDRLREQYESLVERERQLLAAAGVRGGETDRLFGRAAEIEATLDRVDAAVDEVVRERVTEMLRVVDEESANLVRYREQLAALETEAEEVVGGVTLNNFRAVRRRFYDLVLRADVGRIDVAWARREEHRTRVDLLTREQASTLRAMDDEFREIMDLSGGGAGEAQETQP
ncbi:MAG: tetratricopeptide repeat protein [Myxococcota bacterium]|nr:tetratricopeptide repeat protein [Myxococcota bacterium]MDW8362672.1 tetratricopeptide repeat protein [Myxococcales bacterium]